MLHSLIPAFRHSIMITEVIVGMMVLATAMIKRAYQISSGHLARFRSLSRMSFATDDTTDDRRDISIQSQFLYARA